MSRALVILGLAATLLCAPPAHAATYGGRLIDGRTWHCHASTNDYGTFRHLEVRFDGERAYLVFAGGGRIVLILDDEHIIDPHSIVAYDHKRGLRWELDVYDLGER